MIKGRTRPAGGRVALIARGRESRLHVIRIGCAIEIGLVALHACSRIGQVVGPTRAERGVMALGTLQGDVRASKGESRGSVIEGRAGPIGRAVAGLTSRGESRLRLLGIRSAVVIGLMARDAPGRRRQVVSPAGAERGVVALRTLQRDVSAIQGETGRRVVEGCVGPVRRVVTLLASRGESRLDVIRIGRAIEVRLVALDALRVIGQVVRT